MPKGEDLRRIRQRAVRGSADRGCARVVRVAGMGPRLTANLSRFPAQRADLALNEFAQQAHLVVLYPYEEVSRILGECTFRHVHRGRKASRCCCVTRV